MTAWEPQEIVNTREELFARLAAPFAEDRVLYLEFGVWRGASLRIWSDLLRHPSSELRGFDSFDGLPEDWKGRWLKGSMSTAGVLPLITDSRVRIVKGLFSDTLPEYVHTWPGDAFDQVVVCVDCDLYSSTKTVLRCVGPLLRPGNVIYFDEIGERNAAHERRALEEWIGEGADLECLISDTTRTQVGFRVK